MPTTNEILEKIKALENVVIIARVFKAQIQEVESLKEADRLYKLLDMKKLKKTLRIAFE